MACQSFSVNDCVCYPKREQFELLLSSFEITHTIVNRETLQAFKIISMLTVCLDESFAGEIMVMICKRYCCKDVNALAPSILFQCFFHEICNNGSQSLASFLGQNVCRSFSSNFRCVY